MNLSVHDPKLQEAGIAIEITGNHATLTLKTGMTVAVYTDGQTLMFLPERSVGQRYALAHMGLRDFSS